MASTRTIRRIGLLILALAFAVPAAARDCDGGGPAPRRTAIPVFYATDRNDRGNGEAVHWGNESDVAPHYGMIESSILRSCATLVAGYPAWWPAVTDPRHPRAYFAIGRDRPYRDSAEMSAAIAAALTGLQGGDPARPRIVILYLHGYNNGFADAAQRSAQLAFDLGSPVVPVFYSWPSQSSVRRYVWDSTRVQRSQPYVRELIRAILDQVRPDQLHIVAHSMGNRAAIAALLDLARERPDLNRQVTSLTLLSPDVDQILFRRSALPELGRIAGRVALFANRRDRPLAASNVENGGYPLGTYADRGTPFVGAALTTIDTTEVGDSLLRHADFEDQPAIMREIEAGIAGVPLERRSCLERRGTAETGFYYKLDPGRAGCPSSGRYARD